MKLKRVLFNWQSVMLYILVLCTLLLAPLSGWGLRNPVGRGEMGDYVMHFLVYLPWMFGGWILWRERLWVNVWFLVGSGFVIGLEVVQYFLPYRGFNVYDILAGELGLSLSYLLLYARRRYVVNNQVK